MARTKTEIRNNILSELTEVDYYSASKTALWKQLVDAFVSASVIHDSITDGFKNDIESLILNDKRGLIDWYVQQAFAFRYGDELIDAFE